jgi:RNA polymerase sigma-70 factor (ECF subfamily)
MTPAGDALEPVLRHEYGRIVASLLREFGAHRLAAVEDGLGQALLEATLGWRARGVPPNARAWLHRTARYRILDELRRRRGDSPLDAEGYEEAAAEGPAAGLSDDVHDDELRALLACADPAIPLPSQVVFALRTLCGFSTREIATRLVTTEENVQKRWERARDLLRAADLDREPDAAEREGRTEGVLRMIYVLFTEGYFASSGEAVLRLELCQEALRLGALVAGHPAHTSPRAWALVALMHLHHARRDARTDAGGLPILLEAQDRRLYRREELALGLSAFQRAAAGGLGSKYHLEAAIAAEHAFAPTFSDVRWGTVAALYERLDRVDPSPLHALHGAIAVSYEQGPAVALERLRALRPPSWLLGSHLWLATSADLHRRLGQHGPARELYEQAIALAPPLERSVLERRLAEVQQGR